MTRVALAAILLLAACNDNHGWRLQPAIPAGPPLRIGDQLYLLTTQYHPRYRMDSEDNTRLVDRKHYTDLWTFDANTANPLSRIRLHTATADLTAAPAILRAEAGKLSIRLLDGTIATSTIPSQIPAAPAYFTKTATYVFRSRGLQMPGRWLGLLDDAEAALFREKNLLYPNLERPAPRKLWRRINNILSPLTAEFQNPGLLGIQGQPLLLHDPDSILIHHGNQQLTRIAGPAGNALWTTQLPFTVIQSVLPGDTTLILLGAQPNTTEHFIASIQLATGAQKTYNLSLLNTNPPATNP